MGSLGLAVRRSVSADAAGVEVSVGHGLLDEYLRFVAGRCRPNTVLAVAYDLKVFFDVVAVEPDAVTIDDVFSFIAEQRRPRLGEGVVRIEDGEAGLSSRTIRRRITSIAGLFDYLVVRDDVAVSTNPVPRRLATRGRGTRRDLRGVPLIRTPRTLPRILSPDEVVRFGRALRTNRDRSMIDAMLLGGLRRSEVLGLRLEDLNAGQRRLFIAEGKGGHQRIVPISDRFFKTVAVYLNDERPTDLATDRVFVVLKRPRRGRPLSAAGLDEIVRGAKTRAGIDRLTCHQLRHTCFTRLREAGMPIEALQAQAGHRSIDSTKVYLHLSNDWLAGEYLRAAEAIEAEAILNELA